MAFIDTNQLKVIERLPGWKGRYFDSANMTFGRYVFEAGASIHEQSNQRKKITLPSSATMQHMLHGCIMPAGNRKKFRFAYAFLALRKHGTGVA
jgi:hypothetical protein